MNNWARFLLLVQSKLRLYSANHRTGYFSNLPCDWLSIVWAYSEQETENGPLSGLCSSSKAPITLSALTLVLINWYLQKWRRSMIYMSISYETCSYVQTFIYVCVNITRTTFVGLYGTLKWMNKNWAIWLVANFLINKRGVTYVETFLILYPWHIIRMTISWPQVRLRFFYNAPRHSENKNIHNYGLINQFRKQSEIVTRAELEAIVVRLTILSLVQHLSTSRSFSYDKETSDFMIQLIGPWEILMIFPMSNFHVNVSHWWLMYLLWICR